MTDHNKEQKKRIMLCIEMFVIGCAVLYGIICLFKGV